MFLLKKVIIGAFIGATLLAATPAKSETHAKVCIRNKTQANRSVAYSWGSQKPKIIVIPPGGNYYFSWDYGSAHSEHFSPQFYATIDRDTRASVDDFMTYELDRYKTWNARECDGAKQYNIEYDGSRHGIQLYHDN